MFSISESVKYGWAMMKENMHLSVLSTLLMLAVGAVSGGGKGLFKSLFGILAAILLIVIRIGYSKIFLRITDNDKPKFSDIFRSYPLFWKYLGISILFPVIVFVGLLLLILPGILWAVRFSFAPLILVDTNMGIIASMKESWAITEGNFWSLLLFWIVVGVLNFLGFLALGIGLLVSVPVTTFSSIFVYRALSRGRAGITI